MLTSRGHIQLVLGLYERAHSIHRHTLLQARHQQTSLLPCKRLQRPTAAALWRGFCPTS